MSLNIRPAQPEDAPVAARLFVASGPELFRYFFFEHTDQNEWLLEQMFCHEAHAFTYEHAYVAERDGEILGALHMVSYDEKEENLWGTNKILMRYFGLLRLLWRLPRFLKGAELLLPIKEDEMYINHIAVLESCRGQGVGGALLRFAEEESRRRGASMLSLDVEKTNPQAKRLYERYGYTEVELVTSPYVESKVNFKGIHRMERELSEPK